ncbi:MAG: hypothetical protein PHD33_07680, partial [Atribacterota bacterium]|nr:hypothetical protein [Atribacterota bacterium]
TVFPIFAFLFEKSKKRMVKPANIKAFLEPVNSIMTKFKIKNGIKKIFFSSNIKYKQNTEEKPKIIPIVFTLLI